jgi:hypothetical protein
MAEPQKPVRAAGCREGQIEHFPDNSVERGDPQESTFVCRDGQFVPLNRR